MKIIVLAAGRGERLLPLTHSTPKSLLDLGHGRTLLEEQLARMAASGAVDEVVLVTGYRAAQIEAALPQLTPSGLAVRTLFNPFFNVSNNLASLWVARSEMATDCLVTNGDCLFPVEVYKDFVRDAGQGIHLAVTRKDLFDDDDMKVRLGGGMVIEVSKLIPSEEAQAESPGLAMVRGDDARGAFIRNLEALLRDGEYLQRFWLEVFNAIAAGGQPAAAWQMPPGTRWQEIDFHLDLRTARRLLRLDVP